MGMSGNEKGQKLLLEVPAYEVFEIRPKATKYCICIPIINEGDKIRKELERMHEFASLADIIIADGGSNDGSTDTKLLHSLGVRTLLVKTGPGKQGAQLRMAFYYALLQQGYEGVITVDGNNKDGVEAIPQFIQKLDDGYDFVQGSRFIPGGKAVNTPFIREIAVKLIHIPVIRYASGFRYTDTTNAFRAHSRVLLLDNRLQIFRNIFSAYELLGYMSVKAPRLGFNVVEVPVSRTYPKAVKTPTKISFFKGNYQLIKILWNLLWSKYDFKETKL